MRKAVIIVLAILLSSTIPISSGASNLIEVGIVEEVEGRLVHISFSSENTLLTVTTTGNISSHFWGSGTLIHQWSIELNVSANSATPDSTGLLVAVAYTGGVIVVNTETLNITNLNISKNINSAVWDNEGNIWFSDSAERRAREFDNSGSPTGNVTVAHNTGITAMTIISQERIVTGGRDNLVKVHSQAGSVTTTLSDFNSYPTIMYTDDDGDLLVGCSNGQLLRYNVDTWAKEEITISSQENINSITFAENGDLFVGTLNGKLHILNGSSLAEIDVYDSPGRVMLGFFEDTGELYIVSAFTTASKFRLFDLDTDGDGVTDSNDDFKEDSSQDTDTDGDGYGDNPSGNNSDAFPDDFSQWADSDGDGYGDNPSGNNSDAFINNSQQWADSDGDGYGDNIYSEGGDRYPDDSSQWVDSDSDGYGDNLAGTQGDACPLVNGFSTEDRLGCIDTDNDGYSDPTDDWTVADGADTMLSDKTQWRDSDGDGYGDNLTGRFHDSCPLEAGNSTSAWLPIFVDGNISGDYQIYEFYGCPDSDGDGYSDSGDDLADDPNEYRDGDRDNVGYNSDWNDDNAVVQTQEQHCLQDITDNSEKCRGFRDAGYKEYVQQRESDGKSVLEYYSWQTSQAEPEEETGNMWADYLERAGKIAPYLGGGFFVILVVLLVYSSLTKTRRRAALVKRYGEPLGPDAMTAEDEALENKAGLSAVGGVESDKYWEDDVEPMNLETQSLEDEESMLDELEAPSGDMTVAELKDALRERELPVSGKKAELLERLNANNNISEESISTVEETVEPTVEPTAEVATPVPQAPTEVPPLPEEGLPEGWTMEQWKWYGAEWLSRMGK